MRWWLTRKSSPNRKIGVVCIQSSSSQYRFLSLHRFSWEHPWKGLHGAPSCFPDGHLEQSSALTIRTGLHRHPQEVCLACLFAWLCCNVDVADFITNRRYDSYQQRTQACSFGGHIAYLFHIQPCSVLPLLQFCCAPSQVPRGPHQHPGSATHGAAVPVGARHSFAETQFVKSPFML